MVHKNGIFPGAGNDYIQALTTLVSMKHESQVALRSNAISLLIVESQTTKHYFVEQSIVSLY